MVSNTPRPILAMSSGGKDSMYMVERLSRDPAWKIEALVTTVNEDNGRVAMHGTPDMLLRAQAKSLGLPLTVIGLPADCENRTYAARMREGLRPFRDRGIDTIACGDLFLDDIRRWREDCFNSMGWKSVFPIWHMPTDELAKTLSRDPWRVVISCIDTRLLPERLLGRRLDADFLADLPEGVDPCGENGEFHSFVCNGPGFAGSVDVVPGRRVLAHERWLMLDLKPA